MNSKPVELVPQQTKLSQTVKLLELMRLLRPNRNHRQKRSNGHHTNKKKDIVFRKQKAFIILFNLCKKPRKWECCNKRSQRHSPLKHCFFIRTISHIIIVGYIFILGTGNVVKSCCWAVTPIYWLPIHANHSKIKCKDVWKNRSQAKCS